MKFLLAFLSAFILSYFLTPFVRRFSIRYKFISKVRGDRWHKRRVTALLGGIAIYLSFFITLSIFGFSEFKSLLGIILGSTFIFLVGLVDDVKHIRAHAKLFCQIIAACIAVLFGLRVEFFIPPAFSILTTIIWIVVITNSINLLDNMDGLACGVSGIISLSLFASALLLKNEVGLIALVLAGASFGFLPHNFKPAKIFMGDSGSMFLGFNLATLSILGTWHQASNVFIVLMMPVLILAVPIFDTLFVMITRNLNGQSIFKGGKDHASHRLVVLGLSERKAILFLYGITILFSIIALAGIYLNIFIITTVSILFLVFILFLGIFLGQIPLYKKIRLSDSKNKSRSLRLDSFFPFKKRVLEMMMDLLLICTAYLGAYVVRYEGAITDVMVAQIKESLPIIIIIKLLSFFYFGLYRRIWRHTSINDLIVIFKAVFFSSIFSSTAILFINRFSGYSRSLLVIDGMLLLILVGGARILLRVFQEYFFSVSTGKKVIIVGTEDSDEILVREIKNRQELNYQPIGFVGNDPKRVGRRIHGIPILGTVKDLSKFIESEKAEEVLISGYSISDEETYKIQEICDNCKVVYRKTQRIL